MHFLNADWEISLARLVLNCVGSAVHTDEVSEYWAIGRRLLPYSRRCLESTQRGILVQPPDNLSIYKAFHSLCCLYSDQGQTEEAGACIGGLKSQISRVISIHADRMR